MAAEMEVQEGEAGGGGDRNEEVNGRWVEE